ncbi:hypothetical protein [Rhodococcus jostii]|uniref:hypothetical protein n=1 Tax=Rhodococcus jostii TaxID=132919 RepID=UPI003645C38E
MRPAGQSPFDAICQVRPDGSEFWSGRDLQEVTKYARWEDFAKIIERAVASARNSGHDVVGSFSAIAEKPAGGGRPRQDFELSRFVAYLTVMNGDPNMPEVAAAQAYFAIRTREAETSSPAIDFNDPDTALDKIIELASIAKFERAARIKAERRVEVERRHRSAIEGGDGIHLTDFGKKYFSEVPARKFDEHLYSRNWLIDQRNTRVRPDGSIRDGYDHRKPTAKGRPFIYDHDQGNYGGKRRFQPRVRPQKEIELRDALAAEGLPVNTHSTGLILISNDELKGLGA